MLKKVPTMPSDKLSKIQTLKLASYYIEFMHDLLGTSIGSAPATNKTTYSPSSNMNVASSSSKVLLNNFVISNEASSLLLLGEKSTKKRKLTKNSDASKQAMTIVTTNTNHFNIDHNNSMSQLNNTVSSKCLISTALNHNNNNTNTNINDSFDYYSNEMNRTDSYGYFFDGTQIDNNNNNNICVNNEYQYNFY